MVATTGFIANVRREVSLDELSRYRDDFPILSREVNGRKLVYLDSAATSLKPQRVIDAVVEVYTRMTANVHRAIHALSEEVTNAFERSRDDVARFINAEAYEVAFVKNATEAINVVAHSFCDRGVLISEGEHHSNDLPWRGGKVQQVPVDENGGLRLGALEELLGKHQPKLLAISTIGNALGVAHPVREAIALAHAADCLVLLDGSQSVGHEPVDVRSLDCDFFCFSGHKMLGPSGVGVLQVRPNLHSEIKPLLLGGAMVEEVHADSVELRAFPGCLEAGTPPIESVIGLGEACLYLDEIGVDRIQAHCRSLVSRLREGLAKIPKVQLHGDPRRGIESIVNFTVAGQKPPGIAKILSDRFGIMVRSGFHCAQPLHEILDLGETVRVSVHLYNTGDEIDQLVDAIAMIAELP